MKIMFNLTCVQANRLTGIERYALHMALGLLIHDPSVVVISSEDILAVPSTIIPKSLIWTSSLLRQYEYLYRAIWDQIGFRWLVSKYQPDVVFFPIQDGLLFPSVKQIVTVHDLHYLHFDTTIPECRQEINFLRTKLHQYKMPIILKHSAAVVAVSESTKRDIVSAFGVNPDKIHVIHNGYDELRFHLIENPQPTLDRYGLQSGKYYLFVGSILKHKNIARLVQAFARLDTDNKLVIAGACKDTKYLDDLFKIAAGLELSETRMQYLDYVADEDLPSLYNGAVSYLLPSLHEGFGVPIIEAMACGTPVITSNCSAMPEVAGKAALLVDPYSVESITAAMREVLDNAQLVQTLRAAGLERAKMFGWSCAAQKLYNLCKSV